MSSSKALHLPASGIPLRRPAASDRPDAFLPDPDRAERTPGTGRSFWAKRAMDLVCLALGAPAVAVAMCLIALGIKMVSPGPVLFRQERVGYRRQRFVCLKFRTMHCGADPAVHRQHLERLMASDVPMTKIDSAGDRRLIPCGRFLRATGLDELPQLFNVLRGEMSLVGPRPCTPYEFEHYERRHWARFDTLPGLTGLWQVRGKNKTTFSQMIDLDTEYALNRSLWMDLKIMGATVGTLFDQVSETFARR
jgi:lipopolysaccharide/colanic/teichoic acid biosynthesis glycosyltransferase